MTWAARRIVPYKLGAGSDKAWRIRERHLSYPAPKPARNPRAQGSVMSQFPAVAATPASIVDALKAVAGCRQSARELRQGPMCSRHLCPVGSGKGDHEIPELHGTIARAGALLGGRRQSRSGGYEQPRTARLQLQARQTMNIARTFSRKALPVHFARTLDQMLAFLKARIPGPDGKPGLEKVKAFSASQSRNAASGKLHRRASAARQLCRHDLLGRARLSRNELERRDAVHQVQGRCRSATTSR